MDRTWRVSQRLVGFMDVRIPGGCTAASWLRLATSFTSWTNNVTCNMDSHYFYSTQAEREYTSVSWDS